MVMNRSRFLILSIVVIGALLFCLPGYAEAAKRFSVGHTGGNLVAALYRASEAPGWDGEFEAVKFGSSADVGYALLSGSIEAGFIDIVKVRNLRDFPGFEELTALGRVTFPYGATLVLRKGLNLRLGELGGSRIAVSSPECVLFEAFRDDADRLKADLTGVDYAVMPFDTMIPALEAGEVDAAVVKGASAVVALSQGHSILYQNWDVQPGDECCPAIVDQAVQVLLVRKDTGERAGALAERLLRAESDGPEELRGAVARHTTIPLSLLEGQPVPEFNRADDSLVATLAEFLDEEGNKVDPDEGED